MLWAHGHRNDWDYFAAETGDPAWGYDSVLEIYRRIEDWHLVTGIRNAAVRMGSSSSSPAPDPNPIAPAMLAAARSVGIPTFADQNGVLMEGGDGAALVNVLIRDGKRHLHLSGPMSTPTWTGRT